MMTATTLSCESKPTVRAGCAGLSSLVLKGTKHDTTYGGRSMVDVK